MRRAEVKMKLKRGFLCACNQRATQFKKNMFTCDDCLKKDAAIYGTANIRSTCGRKGVEEYRCALATPI